MRSLLLSFFLTCTCSYLLIAGTRNNQGNYLIRHYSDVHYRAHPVNWASFQDKNGRLYVANRSLVLVYDGLSWQRIRVKLNSPVYDMKMGTNGKVYLGMKKDIAYLETDPTGRIVPHSLVNRLPKAYQNIVKNWKVHVDENDVYFQSNEQLIRMKDDQFDTAWVPETAFHFSFQIGQQLYITEIGKGLKRMQGDSLVMVDERFGQDDASKIYAMMGLPDGKVFIATKQMGCFTLDPRQNDLVQVLKTSDDVLLKEAVPYGGTLLSDGNIAINTRKGGVIIMDQNGKIHRQISDKNGLKTNDIRHIYQDSQGGIWLSTNDGIYRVAYDIPFTYWDESYGLSGSLNYLYPSNSYDYIASSTGVFRKKGNEIDKIAGLNQHTWHMATVKGQKGPMLVAASSDGLYEITEKQAFKLTDTVSTYVYESPLLPGTLWVAEGPYLRFYQQRKGQWVRVGQLTDINGKPISGHEPKGTPKGGVPLGGTPLGGTPLGGTPLGGTPLDIIQDSQQNTWVGTKTGGLYKIAPFHDLKSLLQSPIKRYDSIDGLSQMTDVRIREAGDSLIVLAGHQLFKYEEGSDRFTPFSIRENLADTTTHEPVFLDIDSEGAFWVQYNQPDYSIKLTRSFQQAEGLFKVENVPFKMLPRMLMRHVLPKPDGAFMLLGSNMLICYESRQPYVKEKQHRTLIRSLVANQDSVYRGWMSTDTVASNWGLPDEFSYNQNDLTFWFNASCLRSESHNLFQYQLEGDEDQWSEWSGRPVAYFTNLHEGDYVFRVRSKGFDEETSVVSNYYFKILPPWYRSIPIYLLYLLGSICFLWAIVTLNTRRIRRSKDLLEVKVAERTAEIVDQNIKIRSQQDEIIAQNEELQMLNKEKNFLLGAVAHDLKNPLNSIYSVSQLIKMDQERLDAEQLEYIEQIEQISLGLTDKVNEILDVTVIDAKERTVPLKRGEVSGLLKILIKNLQPVATRKDITLCLQDPETKYFAFFEVNLLKKALQNLLDNAIKFSPRGKRVFIALSRPDDRLCISIRDEGPGITASDQQKLFQRFTTLTARPTDGEKSTGLGLSIVKRCVEAMNGSIRCESPPGQGANFIIEL